jgi:ParB-like nuclease domain
MPDELLDEARRPYIRDTSPLYRSCIGARKPEGMSERRTTTGAQAVPVESLAAADSPRLVGEDTTHIHRLAQVESPLPPILVHRSTMRIIDGMHRLAAARLRGDRTIEVRFFDGSAAEAFVIAVNANVTHGLPLSRLDREAAAARIIGTHPHWSDRALAAVTGLATTTIAAIRSRTGDGGTQPPARLGRDGRVRPLNAAAGRRLASRLFADRPDASLREIALAAGISPATARDVRIRMHRGDDPVPAGSRTARREERRRPHAGGPGRVPVGRDAASVLRDLRRDPSLRLAESGRELLRWLSIHAVQNGSWHSFVATTPSHAAYVIAALARGTAREWLEFADRLEQRLATVEGGSDVA